MIQLFKEAANDMDTAFDTPKLQSFALPYSFVWIFLQGLGISIIYAAARALLLIFLGSVALNPDFTPELNSGEGKYQNKLLTQK
jgi:hypothetical protein